MGAQGFEQPQLVQRRGTQFIDQTADIGHHLLGLVFQFFDLPARGLRIMRSQQIEHRVQLQGLTGQGGTKAVVEIAPDAAALFLPGQDQLLAGVLQGQVQPGCRGHRADLRSDIGQQLLFRSRQLLAGPPWGDKQAADRFILVADRQLHGFAARRADRGLTDLLRLIQQLNGGIGQLERGGDGGHDGGQGFGRHGCGLVLLAQAGEHGVRIVTLAVHELIDAALEPLTHGVEGHGHQPGCDQGDDQVPGRLKEEPQAAHRHNVDQDHAQGQTAIDQRAVDDDVDVPELVAEDGNGDGRGQNE